MSAQARSTRLRRAVCAFVLLDALVAAGFVLWLRADRTSEEAARAALEQRVGVQAGDSEQKREERYAQAVAKVQRHVTLSNTMRVENGEIRLDLANASGNDCDVALTLINEAGITLAKTERVAPGYYVESVRLSATLEAGEYRCLARLTFYTQEEGLLLGTSARQVLVIMP